MSPISVYFTLWTKLLIPFLLLSKSNSQLISLQESSKYTNNQVFNSLINTSLFKTKNYDKISSKRRILQRSGEKCPIMCSCSNGVQIECEHVGFLSLRDLFELEDFNGRNVEQLKLQKNNITHLLEDDLIFGGVRKLKFVWNR